ncbi:Protein FAM32A-like [Linum perenne]
MQHIQRYIQSINEFIDAMSTSSYENVVGGKLRLKGKPLVVRDGAISKKKKKHKLYDSFSPGRRSTGDASADEEDVMKKGGESGSNYEEHLTAAERRYLKHLEKLDSQRMAKMASKSHRDRIHEFNHYLANLTEHYDIPKVGPG